MTLDERVTDRMAELASRIVDPDPKEQAYASRLLELHWAMWEHRKRTAR